MKIAVVGAGLHGIMATKICREYGFEVQCFEKFDDIGGIWRYKPEAGQTSVMKNTVTNTSKELMAFSDFPPPDDFPNFTYHARYLTYLEMFADRFDLRKFIEFETEVTKIERSLDYEETGRWKVSSKNLRTEEESSQIFDGVMVVSGRQAQPFWPKFEGMSNFSGRLMHAQDYKNNDGFEDHRTLIIGPGNSGSDIACELAFKCSKVYFSTRNGCWFLSRTLFFGYPTDMLLHRRFVAWFSRLFPSLANTIVEFFADLRFKHSVYGLKSKSRISKQRPTMNDELNYRIIAGQVEVKPQVLEFLSGNVVKFTDGSEVENVDDVIVCTGYEASFLFLEDGVIELDEQNGLDLYKFMYPPHLDTHPTLCFIAMLQPPTSIIQISELQARFHCELLLNRVSLPQACDMRRLTAEQNEFVRRHYGNTNSSPVDAIGYMDELAASFGAKPSLWTTLRTGDIRLALHLAFGPLTPYQYRLQGSHAWQGARDATLNTWNRVVAPLGANCRVADDDTNESCLNWLAGWATNTWCLLFVAFVVVIVFMLSG